MARTIPEETIAEIKARADIAGIIGRTVKLKKVGRNLVGLCPFHNEKTPSFNVHPDDGFFYCFGCKAAGDVVEFLVRTTGRGFLDIITELAAQTGVELPKVDVDPVEEARQKERKRLLRVLELAQVFFRTRLQSDEGRPARKYLSEVRKIDDAAIDQFGLGFAGARDDGLLTFLKEQGMSSEDGVAAGVLGRSRDESRPPYDFFRHRITIPIRGTRGEVLSFQGRIFGERETAPDGTKRPKYVNGPQTPVYDKSVVLFGFFEAQAGLKQGKPAVLVEGPLDAIAIHRAGVPTSVAPCGTSLTPRHVDELKKRTERVVVCLDSDSAGKEAAARAMLMLLSNGLDVGLVGLPDKDPDSMAKEGRLDELRGLVVGAPSALDALIARAREKATGNMRARVAALDELLPFLAAPPRELVRNEAIKAAAKAFNEDEEVIRREVEQKGRRVLRERLHGTREPPRRLPPPSSTSKAAPPQPARAASTTEAMPEDPRVDDEAVAGAPSSPRPVRAGAPPAVPARLKKPSRRFSEPESMLAEALLTHPHLASRCGVLATALSHKELRQFISRLIELLVRFHDEDPRAVLPKVPMQKDGQMMRVLLKLTQSGGFDRPDAYMSEATAARIVDDAILTLDKKVLEVRLGELQTLLAAADERNDHVERKRVLEEQSALVDALRALAIPAAPLSKAVHQALAPALARGPVGGAAAEPAAVPARPPTAEVAAEPRAAAPRPDAPDEPEDAPLPPPPADPPWSGDPEDDPWAT